MNRLSLVCTVRHDDRAEEIRFDRDGSVLQMDPRYQLRPEVVESVFVLWRITGNPKYRAVAWRIFQALQQNASVYHDGVHSGFSGLTDVRCTPTQTPPCPATGSRFLDLQPSYFLAETLKYLLLTFAPIDYLPLDEWVFSTEAHPLRRQHPAKPPAGHTLSDMVLRQSLTKGMVG
jgi:hypothetical protein